MDVTIHITASGAASTIALSLDLLPHQMTAIAHVSSILQMCSLYAESRESQTEVQHQLKMHMEKLNFIQNRVLRQQKQRAASRGRVMRPLPAILCSGHMGQDSEDCDGFHPLEAEHYVVDSDADEDLDLENEAPPRPCVRQLQPPPVPPGSPAHALSEEKDAEIECDAGNAGGVNGASMGSSRRPQQDSTESLMDLPKPDDNSASLPGRRTVTPELPTEDATKDSKTLPSRFFGLFWKKSSPSSRKVSAVNPSRLSRVIPH